MPRESAVDRVQDVYAASYHRLVGQVTRVTGDPAEARDVVVEAFARAVNAHRSFLAADAPEAWLRTVAVDVAGSRLRRRRLSRGPTPRRVPEPGSHDEQPGFDEVIARAAAARRRRRTKIVSGLAAACVIGGVVAVTWSAVPPPEEPGPEPAPISDTVDERLPNEVRQLLRQERIDPWQVTGSGGAIAALWSSCGGDERCRFAVVTRLGDQVAGSLLEGPSPSLAEVPDGWLVADGSGTFRLAPDGARTPVVDAGGNRVAVEAGDTAVETTAGWRLMRGDQLVPVPTPDGREALAAHVTPAGDLVAATSPAPGTVEVSWTDASGRWRTGYVPRTREPVSGVVLAGHHDAVAVAVLGDSPDGSVLVLDVALSGDAGRSWTAGRGLPAGLRDPSALATSDEGTAYLTTGSHGTVRVDAEGNALDVSQSSHDRSAFQVSHRVCLVAESGRVDVLRCSADDGTTWTQMSLPGLR